MTEAAGIFVQPAIVVGIDGSPAAEHAARWALDEAARRELPLRRVAVEAGADTEEAAAALLAASHDAAMLCVGSGGLEHALLAGARCPLAVVRGSGGPGWVVVELDETGDSAAVLQAGVQEARLRNAPLRVLGTWQTDDKRSFQLDRRLDSWRDHYPDLDVEPVAVPGSGLDWLSGHAQAIQLVVIGARNIVAVTELLGPAGRSALPDTSVLVLDRQRLL